MAEMSVDALSERSPSPSSLSPGSSVGELTSLCGSMLTQPPNSVSSVDGGVESLWSRLQAKRISLNVEIGKEELFKTGSRRLASVSTDLKSRQQASLEMSFAESKIQALQAELTKLNSSLQAFQSDSARETQVPLIPLAMKTTDKISFVSAFSDVISRHYHSDPASFQEGIFTFQELRNATLDVPRSEAGVRLLYRYHNLLQIVSRRFIHANLCPGLSFTWYDAVNGVPASQTNVVYERACVLFNIGALHTQIAAQQDRSTTGAIDAAVRELERAVGCFEYMTDKFSHSPTLDMSERILSFFSNLMKAQVHDLRWERQCLEGLSESTVSELIDLSHRTRAVAECYRCLKEEVEKEAMKQYLPGCWCTLVKIKDAHFKALAHYYAALAHEKLAAAFRGGDHVPEEVRTEVHFLYVDCPPEVRSCEAACHAGLLRSHLHGALLAHEYALKYSSLCRDLWPILPLHEMLKEWQKKSEAKSDEAVLLDAASIIAPTILPEEVRVSPVLPQYGKLKVQDLFAALGPLSAFCADKTWSPPRLVTMARGTNGYGFSLRGSRPVTISAIEGGSTAERAGVQVGDWVLSVRGEEVRHCTHRDVVKVVRECQEEVCFELVSPAANSRAPS